MTTATTINQELQVLETLRAHRKRHRQGLSTQITAHVEQPIKPLTVGQKISDAVARTVGSWKFIIIQSVCILGWITYNSVNNANVWDPYPFILLNLMLSFQAAYTAPAIMMSQNRLSEIDRQQANNDFSTLITTLSPCKRPKRFLSLLSDALLIAGVRMNCAIAKRMAHRNVRVLISASLANKDAAMQVKHKKA